MAAVLCLCGVPVLVVPGSLAFPLFHIHTPQRSGVSATQRTCRQFNGSAVREQHGRLWPGDPRRVAPRGVQPRRVGAAGAERRPGRRHRPGELAARALLRRPQGAHQTQHPATRRGAPPPLCTPVHVQQLWGAGGSSHEFLRRWVHAHAPVRRSCICAGCDIVTLRQRSAS